MTSKKFTENILFANVAYENAVNTIIVLFIKKQNLEFDGWVGDKVGEVASFISQYFFNLSDILLDLKKECKKGFILEWHDETIENEPTYINYSSYQMGLRYENL